MSDLRRDTEYLAKVIDANVIQYDKNVGADHFGWLVSWIEHYMGKVAEQQREAGRLEGLREAKQAVESVKSLCSGVYITHTVKAIEAKIAEGGK